MTSGISPLRPRLVIHMAKDGSLDFAATSDIEVIIVREGFGNFRAFPSLKVGLEHVRRLLSGLRPVAARGAVSKKEAAS
jgi:hypothetical protein